MNTVGGKTEANERRWEEEWREIKEEKQRRNKREDRVRKRR